ncbi:hypothetical protein D3C74_269150 [compost metagenome]
MMQFNENLAENLDHILKGCESEEELRHLRRIAWGFLHNIDKRIGKKVPSKDNSSLCPLCRSSNTKKHSNSPLIRSYCLDCKRAYLTHWNTPSFFYRKHNHKKIFNFIFLIYRTDKTVTQIINELKISKSTYYSWKKGILPVHPFLEPFFKKRR